MNWKRKKVDLTRCSSRVSCLRSLFVDAKQQAELPETAAKDQHQKSWEGLSQFIGSNNRNVSFLYSTRWTYSTGSHCSRSSTTRLFRWLRHQSGSNVSVSAITSRWTPSLVSRRISIDELQRHTELDTNNENEFTEDEVRVSRSDINDGEALFVL